MTVNHPETAYRLLAERAYLRELEGEGVVSLFLDWLQLAGHHFHLKEVS